MRRSTTRASLLSRPARRSWPPRWAQGTLLGLVVLAGLVAVMILLRPSLSVATAGLVLVVPVVVAVTTGGFVAGAVAVSAGFLAYDFVFIPPYYTLAVGHPENWASLGVYVVVMLLVARVVASVDRARAEAARRDADARRLFEMTEELVADRPVERLLERATLLVCRFFDLRSVVLFLPPVDQGGADRGPGPGDGPLVPVASAGEPLSPADLARLTAPALSLGPEGAALTAVPISASGTPIGLLGLHGRPGQRFDRELLATLANHIALAVERSRLRSDAQRADLLAEVDRVRRAMMGAASHDLRTPLAAIKGAASTLRNPEARLDDDDRAELLVLIDEQADRLSRFVGSLLDLSRIQAGAVVARREPTSLTDLVGEGVAAFVGADRARLRLEIPSDLPLVDVDVTLSAPVLYNLLDNALRHSPPESPVVLRVQPGVGPDPELVLSVLDQGPGVPEGERAGIFEPFIKGRTSAGAGLGLAIAKAFVEAQGQDLWVDEAPGGGAAFHLRLPAAAAVPELGRA
jgi:two-component system sensor histidine kinase KdpD